MLVPGRCEPMLQASAPYWPSARVYTGPPSALHSVPAQCPRIYWTSVSSTLYRLFSHSCYLFVSDTYLHVPMSFIDVSAYVVNVNLF